jgi:hypothetical protein
MYFTSTTPHQLFLSLLSPFRVSSQPDLGGGVWLLLEIRGEVYGFLLCVCALVLRPVESVV